MKKLSRLFVRFKEKDRKESDCSVVSKIVAEYYTGDRKRRSHVVRWAFEQIKDSDIISLVSNLIINFLYHNRHELSKERQREFKEFVRSSKKARKHIKSFQKYH